MLHACIYYSGCVYKRHRCEQQHINVNLALFLFAGGGDVRDSG